MACEDVDPDIDPLGTMDPALVARAKAVVTAWFSECETLSDWDDVAALDDLSRRIALALNAVHDRLWALAVKFETCAAEAEGTGFPNTAELFKIAAKECRKVLS